MANAFAPQSKNSLLDSLYGVLSAAAASGKRIAQEDIPAYAAALQKQIADAAETMPTAEQNINALRRGASDVYGRLSEGAGAVMGGLNRMADMASSEGAGIRDQIMQRYAGLTPPVVPQAQNPMGGWRGPYNAPVAPHVPMYLAPDGSGELWPREKIEAYYDQLHRLFNQNVIQYNPSEQTSAPTRAAFRKRQERKANETD